MIFYELKKKIKFSLKYFIKTVCFHVRNSTITKIVGFSKYRELNNFLLIVKKIMSICVKFLSLMIHKVFDFQIFLYCITLDELILIDLLWHYKECK